jgi:hypothetical protein
MLYRARILKGSLALLVGPALICVLGCSDDGLGKRYPVSGTVTYQGKPVAKARINFVPKAAGGHGAAGDVENGSFSLTTLSPGDGALPGEYKVSIDAREVDDQKLKAETDKVLAKKNKGEMKVMMPIPELQAKAVKEAKSSIPTKYQSAEASKLDATVKEQSNSFEFKLTDD